MYLLSMNLPSFQTYMLLRTNTHIVPHPATPTSNVTVLFNAQETKKICYHPGDTTYFQYHYFVNRTGAY